MNISGILSPVPVFRLFIRIIVELSDLISAVKHWDSRLGKHICMKHQVKGNRSGQFFLITFIQRAFHAAHGSCCRAEPGILRNRIIIVQFTSALTVFPISGKIAVQETFVLCLLHPPALQSRIVQSPANIIMAAQVI